MNKFNYLNKTVKLILISAIFTSSLGFTGCSSSKDTKAHVTQAAEISAVDNTSKDAKATTQNNNASVVPGSSMKIADIGKKNPSTDTIAKSTSPKAVPSAPKKNTQVKGGVNQGIKTKYGTHTYGCRNQEEYDKVIQKVESVVGNESYIDKNSLSWRMLQEFKAGKRAKDYKVGGKEYLKMTQFEKSIGYFSTKVSSSNVDLALESGIWYNTLYSNAKDPGDGSPRSAYDVLFRKIGDCDAQAQLDSAIFDVLGFNNMIRCNDNHAWTIVQIDGKWWTTGWSPANPKEGRQLASPTF